MSINPNSKHHFINVHLAKILQVPAKQMKHTQVNNEQLKVYKDLKISMDKYVLHSDFYFKYSKCGCCFGIPLDGIYWYYQY